MLSSGDNYKYGSLNLVSDLIVLVNEKIYEVTLETVENNYMLTNIIELNHSIPSKNHSKHEKTHEKSHEKPIKHVKSSIVLESFEWIVGSSLATVTFQSQTPQNDVNEPEFMQSYQRVIQYEGTKNTSHWLLRHLGSQVEVQIRTKKEHALYEYMLPMEVKDVSNYLLCPMPGTLISLSK